MADDQWQSEVSKRIIAGQIVVGSTIAGCVFFLVIAFLVRGWPPAPAEEETIPLVGYVGLAVAAAAVAIRLVIPAAIMSRSRQQIADGTWRPGRGGNNEAKLREFLQRTGDAGHLWLLFLTRTVIAAAILESAAFVCGVAYLISPSTVNLVVAVLLLVGVALEFPRRQSVLRWIEEQRRMIDELRSFGR